MEHLVYIHYRKDCENTFTPLCGEKDRVGVGPTTTADIAWVTCPRCRDMFARNVPGPIRVRHEAETKAGPACPCGNHVIVEGKMATGFERDGGRWHWRCAEERGIPFPLSDQQEASRLLAECFPVIQAISHQGARDLADRIAAYLQKTAIYER